MKVIRVILIFLVVANFRIAINAQDESDHEALFFLETDTTWRKEIFIFPLGFAKDIPYEGIEDARFPVGWEHIESPNFWSYAFAWNITGHKSLTREDLEVSLQLYFDGLMEVNSNTDKIAAPKNTSVLLHKGVRFDDSNTYTGKITTYDRFFTKETMTLHVLVEHYYCDEKNKSIILFRFSPKSFDDTVWSTLKSVKLRGEICKY